MQRAGSPLFAHSHAPRHAFPMAARMSFVSLVVVLVVLLVQRLYPSPWTTHHQTLFRRPPPPLARSQAISAPVAGCQNTALTTLEPREKGAIVVLLRHSDLESLIPTLVNFEQRFNARFRYPYVFIASPDEGPFSNEFRQKVVEGAKLPSDAVVEWSVIDEQDWSIPSWLDADPVREGFARQEKAGMQYAGREGYHHMCRFYSGLWARQPVLSKYDWYWRLEPGGEWPRCGGRGRFGELELELTVCPRLVRFYCDITYDPFRFMSVNNKIYGFVITIVENMQTIPTLFETVVQYARQKGITPQPGMWDFLVRHDEKTGEEVYSGCHFWTNFEVRSRSAQLVFRVSDASTLHQIGDLRFFRSSKYQSFFDELDRAGGFYTERVSAVRPIERDGF